MSLLEFVSVLTVVIACSVVVAGILFLLFIVHTIFEQVKTFRKKHPI